MDNRLLDLSFVGPPFTCVNMQHGHWRTWERLDRGVASTVGRLVHLAKIASNHRPADAALARRGISVVRSPFGLKGSGGELMASVRL